MQITASMYLIVLPMVFLAAIVDSVGGGGGLISLPAYTLAGLDYGMASGCNKFSACIATFSSTLRFWKSGKIKWGPSLCAVAGALPGAYLGTKISLLLSQEFMRMFMICAIPVVAVVMFLRRNTESREKPITKMRLVLCVIVGLVVGMYDGFFGPGTGTFLILLLNAVTGMDMVTASATSKPVNLASNISSLITRICAGQVIFALAVPAMFLAVAGAQIGTKLALTKGAKFIRWMMILVLILLIVKLIFDMV